MYCVAFLANGSKTASGRGFRVGIFFLLGYYVLTSATPLLQLRHPCELGRALGGLIVYRMVANSAIVWLTAPAFDDSVTEQAANAICSHIEDAQQRADCLFDAAVSGSTAAAAASVRIVAQLSDTQSAVLPPKFHHKLPLRVVVAPAQVVQLNVI